MTKLTHCEQSYIDKQKDEFPFGVVYRMKYIEGKREQLLCCIGGMARTVNAKEVLDRIRIDIIEDAFKNEFYIDGDIEYSAKTLKISASQYTVSVTEFGEKTISAYIEFLARWHKKSPLARA